MNQFTRGITSIHVTHQIPSMAISVNVSAGENLVTAFVTCLNVAGGLVLTVIHNGVVLMHTDSMWKCQYGIEPEMSAA